MIQNNSIIQAAMIGSTQQLQCVSALASTNVGQFIAPNGSDISNDSSVVTSGDASDPGFVSLQLSSFINNNQGVYTCIIPDEYGVQQYLHVGIYYGRFNSK